MSIIETELTKRLGIKYPILLAGMAKVSNPELAAAVSNGGGLGVTGGVKYSWLYFAGSTIKNGWVLEISICVPRAILLPVLPRYGRTYLKRQLIKLHIIAI